MFITGLVLFARYYHHDFRPTVFWKRRFVLIVIPYIVWTALYILFKGSHQPQFYWSASSLVKDFGVSLLTGRQFFLYYLVVTVQLYMVFPLLLLGLRKFERWHLHIFIGSFVLQLFLMWTNQNVPLTWQTLPPVLKELYEFRDRFILTYQFWFVTGGLFACHYERILAHVDRHARALRLTLAVGVLVLWGHYFFDRLVLGQVESMAELVLQPIMVPYSLLVALNMWYAGVQWSRRRTRAGWQPFSRFVRVASATSFGIFLVQPFPLHFMEGPIMHMHLPAWIRFIIWPFAILAVYFAAMFIAYWLGKIPLVSYIVGRETKVKPCAVNAVSSMAE